MSRHSKWSKVKQFKGAIDAKRSASFTKLGREITVAAREKGGDPAMNARLRAAIMRAREASMPKDTIERAIAKGTGDGGGETIEALRYEAYAPGGTALIIEALTDNRNRTANDLKHILSKNGGTLALAGAVTFLFDHRGVIQLAGVETLSEEEELSLIDAGAEDILRGEGIIEIKTQPSHLATLTDVALKLFPGAKLVSSEFEWIPKSLVETDEVMAQAVMALTDALEDHDDISRIFSNLA